MRLVTSLGLYVRFYLGPVHFQYWTLVKVRSGDEGPPLDGLDDARVTAPPLRPLEGDEMIVEHKEDAPWGRVST